MQKHKVAVIINDMKTAGGIQRVAANIVRDLQAKHDVMLLSVEPLCNPVFFEKGLDFRSLNVQRQAVARTSYLFELARTGKRLRSFVRQNEIDTVLAIWYDWACVSAWALPRSVKKIGCEHISYMEASRFWQLMRQCSYPHLDAVVSLTQEDVPLLTQITRSVHVIPNSIRVTDLPPASGREKLLLTVGHLIPRKGIDRLLWALKEPLWLFPEWRLIIVGGGEKSHVDWDYMKYISSLIHMLGLEDYVEFHPATQQIDDWYKRASLYVLGSRQEGLPMVLIEAKAHGLPIVSFDCPTGPKEIVRHEIDGFLIKDNSHEFAEAAKALMGDQQLWGRMSAAAFADVVDRFSTEPIIQKWCKLIDTVHQGKDKARPGHA